MKTLLTNGCSWTYGGGLSGTYTDQQLHDDITWPAHLKTILNCDQHYNFSMGCGSNQRIVRTTLDWILKQDRATLSNTTAVIQWTDVSRYEYYSLNAEPEKYNNWNWENDPNNWALVKAGVCIYPPSTMHERTHREFNDSQIRFRTYSDIEALYNFISHMTAMAHIFESYNIKYYYWNALGVPVKYFPDELRTYASKFNWINIDHDFWVYDRVSEQDCHPNENGHKQIAGFIFNEIERLNNGLL